MQSWADRQQTDLSETYGGCWDIWYVFNGPVGRGYTWCARRKGTPRATINTDSPENLIAAIHEQEASA
jgi:hypothetical protein